MHERCAASEITHDVAAIAGLDVPCTVITVRDLDAVELAAQRGHDLARAVQSGDNEAIRAAMTRMAYAMPRS